MPFMKIAVCGSMGVGKTSLLTKMTENRFFPFSEPTIGAGFHSVRIDDTHTVEIWDTSGQERYRSLVRMYFRNATAVMIVYDVQSRQSFDDVVRYWLRIACEHVESSHVYLVGNKADRPGDQRRVVAYNEGVSIAAQWKLCDFVEMSAQSSTADDIMDVFSDVYRRFAHEVEDRGDRMPSICIERPATKTLRRCC